PGEMTEARVWIQNRSHEPVPVDVRDMHLDAPLKVQVMNGQPFVSEPVLVRMPRPTWEYDMVAIPADVPPAAALNPRGAAGWETTGITWTKGDGSTTLLLKRSR